MVYGDTTGRPGTIGTAWVDEGIWRSGGHLDTEPSEVLALCNCQMDVSPPLVMEDLEVVNRLGKPP